MPENNLAASDKIDILRDARQQLRDATMHSLSIREAIAQAMKDKGFLWGFGTGSYREVSMSKEVMRALGLPTNDPTDLDRWSKTAPLEDVLSGLDTAIKRLQ